MQPVQYVLGQKCSRWIFPSHGNSQNYEQFYLGNYQLSTITNFRGWVVWSHLCAFLHDRELIEFAKLNSKFQCFFSHMKNLVCWRSILCSFTIQNYECDFGELQETHRTDFFFSAMMCIKVYLSTFYDMIILRHSWNMSFEKYASDVSCQEKIHHPLGSTSIYSMWITSFRIVKMRFGFSLSFFVVVAHMCLHQVRISSINSIGSKSRYLLWEQDLLCAVLHKESLILRSHERIHPHPQQIARLC